MIVPITFRVMIKPDEVKKTTASGLHLALDEKMERQAQVSGVILAIGEDAFEAYKVKTKFAGLKIGDRVFYAKYAGKWIRDSKTLEEFLLLNDEDIVAKEVSDANPTNVAS